MKPDRISITVFITLLATVSTPFTGCFSVPFSTPLASAQNQSTRKVAADRLFQQGTEQYQARKFEAAIQFWQQARTIYQQLQDRQGEGTALRNLGATYITLENYNKAIEFLQPFLTIARIAVDRRGEGQALGNLGIAYEALGDYSKAITFQQQALALMRTIKDRQGEGQVLGNLGNAYEALGDYSRAIESYQQSLTIAREVNDRRGEGAALGNLGAIYANQGEYNKAIEFYQQSLTIAQVIGDRERQGTILNSLGAAYHVKGNRDRATEYYTQSLTIARAVRNRSMEAIALGSLGIVYDDLSDYGKAIEYDKQSLAIARAIDDRRSEGSALNNLGKALYKSGHLVEAERKLRTALEVLESLKLGLDDNYKVSIFDTQHITYRLLQKVLIAKNKPEAALEIAERGRASAFVQLLAKQLASSVVNSINLNPPTIQQIQQIARQQKATLVEYSILPEESLFQGKSRGQESKLLIWVVQPTGEVALRQVDLKSLQQQTTSLVNLAHSQGIAVTGRGFDPTLLTRLIRDTQESVGVRGGSAGNLETVATQPNLPRTRRRHKKLQQLYQLLIQPIADLLPNNPNARIIFIPQESLFLVPFSALQDNSYQYLVEQHTLLTAPSIQVLALTHQQQQRVQAFPGNRALVVGNPTMPFIPGNPPYQLPQLPGAEQEAIAIAQLLHTQAITGDRATKAAVVQQMPEAKLIHLATHGILDDIKELGPPGELALAPSMQDSGFLTAGEILQLHLHAGLVVLSACNSGLGTITGDGVIGLSRSLISAGVPSVVVSLWQVPDDATKLLMTEFYQQLQHNPDKAQALRQAMLTAMGPYPEPEQWAAFTLIGEALSQ